jgi:hypothetical protein
MEFHFLTGFMIFATFFCVAVSHYRKKMSGKNGSLDVTGSSDNHV